MRPALYGAATLAVLLAAGPAIADEADWLRCRSIADAAARLACYDAVQPAAAPARPAAGVAAPTTAAAAPSRFGLEEKSAETVDAVTSTLPGVFEGWGPRQRFKLANGQVWQLTEGGSRTYQLRDPKVTIRRAALGSFLMEIEGVAQVLRVRRVE